MGSGTLGRKTLGRETLGRRPNPNHHPNPNPNPYPNPNPNPKPNPNPNPNANPKTLESYALESGPPLSLQVSSENGVNKGHVVKVPHNKVAGVQV